MGHGYVRNHYGDNCHFSDSSYKRYNRYHYERCGCDSLSTYLAGNGCCHSHSAGCGGMGLFWPNLVSGLCQGVLGMFAGGFGGGWGFGMPSFGMGGYSGGWDFGAGWLGTSQADGVDGASRRAARAERYAARTGVVSDTVNVGNKDTETLAGFNDRLDKLIAQNGDDDTVDKLIADINAKIKKQDDNVQNDYDITNYKALLARVNNFKDGKIDGVDSNVVQYNGGNITIKIGNQEVESLDDLNKVNIDELKKLLPETATMVLLKLGFIAKDNFSTKHWRNSQPTQAGTTDYLCGKASTNGRVMLLLSKANIAVELIKGTSGNKVDNWVTGLIPENTVEINEDGTLKSCEIDCRNAGEPGYRGQYHLEQNNNNYKLVVTNENTTTTVYGGENLTYDTNTKQFQDSTLKISKKNK